MMRALLSLFLISFALNSAAGKPLTERLKHGKQVYIQSCAVCHDTGESGAPMLTQPEQWSERSDLWEAQLFKHANEGYGLMPSEGGNQELEEYDVDAAAEYIMSEVFPERATD